MCIILHTKLPKLDSLLNFTHSAMGGYEEEGGWNRCKCDVFDVGVAFFLFQFRKHYMI